MPVYDYEALRNQTVIPVGAVGTQFSTNEAIIDMHLKLFKHHASVTPFLSDLSRLAEGRAKSSTIRWGEIEAIPDRIVVVNDAGTGTSLTVQSNGPSLVIDTVLYHPDLDDYATVDATPTTNAVTITRSALGSTAADWQAGDVLLVTPPMSVEDEDGVYRTSMAKQSEGFNYVGLIRMGTAITITGDETHTHWGGPGAKRRQFQEDKLDEIKRKIENMIMVMGRSASATTTTSALRYPGGVADYLSGGTLWKDFNGQFTESGFRKYLLDYVDQNPDLKGRPLKLYTSRYVIEKVANWLKNEIRIAPESETHGFDVFEYKAAGTRVNLIPMPLLTDPVTKGWGFIFDMDNIMMKYMDSGRLKLMKNVKDAPGKTELYYDLYRTQFTLMLARESRHAMFVGANLL